MFVLDWEYGLVGSGYFLSVTVLLVMDFDGKEVFIHCLNQFPLLYFYSVLNWNVSEFAEL